MSNENEAADEVCASCGKPAVDDVKLKKCACDLVKYCSVDCQKDHRPLHKKICKKRLAELSDRDLFEQPRESHLGECPICCLPLQLDPTKSILKPCCSKLICNGCEYANQKREFEAGLEMRCAFCREPSPKSDRECDKRRMERVKKNDPVAMRAMGAKHFDRGENEIAFEYFTKAAEMGDAKAYYGLSLAYRDGKGVEKDKIKYIYHSEEAAIRGHPYARFNLGMMELSDGGSAERAKKHFIIAANVGDDKSLTALKRLYKNGYASKEDYADALGAYQAAVEATKSEDRETAEQILLRNGG